MTEFEYENLIDRDALFKYESKKIKKRIEEYEKIEERNKYLVDENTRLKAQLYNFFKEFDAKCEECLKDYERKKFGYAKGDKVFIVKDKKQAKYTLCPVCGGKHKLTINGIEIDCVYCDCEGQYLEWETIYEIIEATIEDNNVLITFNDKYDEYTYSCYRIHYSWKGNGDCGTKTFDGVIKHDTPVFKTKEEAEEYLKNKEINK